MSEILHADIFFFITGIAVIVLTFLLSIALFHFIKLMKSVRRIAERIDEGSEAIADDIENLRVYITEESPLARFFSAAADDEDDEPQKSSRRAAPRAEKNERKARTELRIKNEE